MWESFKISPRILKRGDTLGELDMNGNIVVQRSLKKYLYIPNGVQISQKTEGCDLYWKP